MFMKTRSSKTTLTKGERQRLLGLLTPEQRVVIQNHVRFQRTSLFANQNLLGESTNWEFMEYHFNDNYDTNQGPQLFCDCGRRLKHQYILRNLNSGKTLKLGINHFADHTDIPEKVMKQLQNEIHHLDFGLDETLRRFRRGVKLNPELEAWLLKEKPEQFDKYAFDYAKVALPLTVEDTQLVRNEFAKHERQLKKASEPVKPRTRRTKKVKKAENKAKVDMYLKAFDW